MGYVFTGLTKKKIIDVKTKPWAIRILNNEFWVTLLRWWSEGLNNELKICSSDAQQPLISLLFRCHFDYLTIRHMVIWIQWGIEYQRRLEFYWLGSAWFLNGPNHSKAEQNGHHFVPFWSGHSHGTDHSQHQLQKHSNFEWVWISSFPNSSPNCTGLVRFFRTPLFMIRGRGYPLHYARA